MKIKHYSKPHIAGIRSRYKEIIDLSFKIRLQRDNIFCYKLMIETKPLTKDFAGKCIQDAEQDILDKQKLINEHKVWIERKSPRFWKRVSFVAEHVPTWDIEIPSVCVPVHTHTEHTFSKERIQTLQRRRQIMLQWYVFFCGNIHIKSKLKVI